MLNFKYKVKKVVITGHSGFVGSSVLSYFEKTHEFICLDRSDLLSDFPDSDCILHLAGKAHDLSQITNPDEYYSVNYELTKVIYDNFLKSNASKFIFVSSVKAAADKLDKPLTEDVTAEPRTHYGKSKLLAEEYIQDQPLPKEKSFFILRPCMIHGPGNKGNLNLLYKFVSKGIPYPLAGFNNNRSFLSIENLCFVIAEFLERNDIPSGVYNIADDEALSTNELIEIIATNSGRKAIFWKINRGLVRLLARIGDVLKLPLTSERLDKLTENYIVDNSKMRAALQKELPVKVRDGIIRTVSSFRS